MQVVTRPPMGVSCPQPLTPWLARLDRARAKLQLLCGITCICLMQNSLQEIVQCAFCFQLSGHLYGEKIQIPSSF